MILPWLVTGGILLAVYFLIDSICYRKDVQDGFEPPKTKEKFGIDGGWIHVALRRTDTGAQLTVQDNGVGISQEDLDRIWAEGFIRPTPSRQESGGTGSGPVDGAADRGGCHGGTVAVTSAPGRGTTFTVTLPEHHGKEEK